VDLLGDVPPAGYSNEQCISDFTPGAQCLREYEFRYGLYPYAGDMDAGQAKRECERFLHPPRAFQLPADRRKWEGYRPGAPKFFDYFEDEHSRLPEPPQMLATEFTLVGATGGDVVLSALKFPEAREGDSGCAIARFVNYTHSSQYVNVSSNAALNRATLVRMNEEQIKPLDVQEGRSVSVTLSAKQVLSLRIDVSRLP
jgi:alpha-mannosidase